MKGYIFRCNDKTRQEVFDLNLFGEEMMYLPVVKLIQPEDLLFLYDLSTFEFSGPYKPVGVGAERIVPGAWKSGFPAQIKFVINGEAKTIPFRLIEKVIKKYHKGMYPDMELDEGQVKQIFEIIKNL